MPSGTCPNTPSTCRSPNDARGTAYMMHPEVPSMKAAVPALHPAPTAPECASMFPTPTATSAPSPSSSAHAGASVPARAVDGAKRQPDSASRSAASRGPPSAEKNGAGGRPPHAALHICLYAAAHRERGTGPPASRDVSQSHDSTVPAAAFATAGFVCRICHTFAQKFSGEYVLPLCWQ